jgi:hypothetical protein
MSHTHFDTINGWQEDGWQAGIALEISLDV